MKEGGGGDNLAVRWLMPDGTDQAPMVATNLLPYGISFAAPVIAEHPAPATAIEGGKSRFFPSRPRALASIAINGCETAWP